MIRLPRLFVGAAVLCAAASCTHIPRGGDPESQLAAATQALDVAKVKQLLSSGADPNKVVEVQGNSQSAWYLALYQLRTSKPATSEIVIAMLGAGANPRVAWGTTGGRPKPGFWEKFMSGSRNAGTNDEHPLSIAMSHPVPAVVKAIVSAGFDPAFGTTWLIDAVELNEPEIVHLLVEKGVDANRKTQSGSPLGAAIATRNVALMTYLEEHGATEKGR